MYATARLTHTASSVGWPWWARISVMVARQCTLLKWHAPEAPCLLSWGLLWSAPIAPLWYYLEVYWLNRGATHMNHIAAGRNIDTTSDSMICVIRTRALLTTDCYCTPKIYNFISHCCCYAVCCMILFLLSPYIEVYIYRVLYRPRMRTKAPHSTLNIESCLSLDTKHKKPKVKKPCVFFS